MYYLLTENFKELHKNLIRIILDAVPADKVYFLGSTLMHRMTESIFIMDAPTCRYVSQYYVLVLVGNEHNLDAAQDKIENNSKHFIPVTAIVLYLDQFNQWLEVGHPFAKTVCSKSVLLHGAKEGNLMSPPMDEKQNNTQRDLVLNQGINKVKEFLAGAELYCIRKQNKMAVFMLHQATENVLHTILKMTTGLNLNTHNLDKLIRYCSMVLYNISDIFSRNNERGERLFQLLQRAFVESRYKEDYSIRTDDIITLTEKVRTLMDILRNIKPV